MSTLTTTEIITSAYRKTGKQTTPTTAQKTSALEDLHSFLGQLNVEGIMIPWHTIEDLTLVVGQMEYTIGTGGDFNTVRPIKIHSAYIRDADGIDRVIDVGMTREEHNIIADKTITTKPRRLFYNPVYPLGKIFFDAESDYAYTLKLISEKPHTEYAIDTAMALFPEEYRMFLVYNLAVILAADKNITLHPSVVKIARATMRSIRANNAKIKPAEIDPALVRKTMGAYDVWTGEVI